VCGADILQPRPMTLSTVLGNRRIGSQSATGIDPRFRTRAATSPLVYG
jgi:hypothetical protein